MAAAHIAVNYRVNKIGHRSFDEIRKLFKEQMFLEENSDSLPIPLSSFSESELKLNLYMSMSSTLQANGLHQKFSTLMKIPIGEFLGERYNYWKDDVPHENYFD